MYSIFTHGLIAVIAAALLTSAATAGEPYPRAGWIAEIPPGQHDVQGVATIIDAQTILVEHFYYDGLAPAVYFYLGADNTFNSFLNGLEIPPMLGGPYFDETLMLTLPAGETLDGYEAISVWCALFSVNFSSASFEPPPCPADVNGDAAVDVLDLLAVLADWGQPGAPGDINGDGAVDVLDLLEVLAAWGPCA